MNRIFKFVMTNAVLTSAAFAQTQPVVILEIDATNCVSYQSDVADYTKYATDPNPVAGVASKNFNSYINICDIVKVNGAPAKGTVVSPNQTIGAQPTPAAGKAIADITRSAVHTIFWEIQKADGTPVGSITGEGFGGGTGVPGAPSNMNQGNNTVTGGTGAFFGIRGQWGTTASLAVALPVVSVTEDPAIRRNRPGGGFHQVLQLIPYDPPTVLSTPGGPAVTHGDFSLVTAASPAKAGESLLTVVSGMGPTNPSVDPGKPFPSFPGGNLLPVNSPVSVTVNGKAAEVINAIGYPDTVGKYRVDFRVPADTPKGTATIQIGSAWITGPTVTIPIQ